MFVDVDSDYEVAILARVLGNDQDELPAAMARYLTALEFGAHDKERMHQLAMRNQSGALSKSEKEELLAYAKAGTVLSILKSKARRVLKIKPRKRTSA